MFLSMCIVQIVYKMHAYIHTYSVIYQSKSVFVHLPITELSVASVRGIVCSPHKVSNQNYANF
ncbi:hypothetical protein LSH36_482g01022 [Paralvinella palmiformis]|uniref:Uncharacterized protein n=1 Tax=Paralvinella palmiformis TaxID=53620 RepID=A0AAD9MZJ8_9ANNE|nr:hypothetical protein LSH36_482g01022 [Paralvinella palmiformis]